VHDLTVVNRFLTYSNKLGDGVACIATVSRMSITRPPRRGRIGLWAVVMVAMEAGWGTTLRLIAILATLAVVLWIARA
jgi:hypothetical protein